MSYPAPLITIAVPAYNAGKYLRKCMNSLINQTIREIEIIVVNDGSTDDSEKILKEYAEKDKRIEIIYKENGGLASARQAALEVSRGQFFCVCDADDWVEPTMYERLYKKAIESGADIVICDYWSEFSDGKRIAVSYNKDLSKRDDLLDDLLKGDFPQTIWGKLIKRDLFGRYLLSWEIGINQGEDLLMSMKILLHNVKVAYVQECLYHYRRELGGSSYTNNITMASFCQMLAIREWAIENLDNKRYAQGIHYLWINLAFTGLRVKEGMDSALFRRTTMSHLPLINFVRYGWCSPKAIVVLFVKVFGYQCGRWLVYLGNKILGRR